MLRCRRCGASSGSGTPNRWLLLSLGSSQLLPFLMLIKLLLDQVIARWVAPRDSHGGFPATEPAASPEGMGASASHDESPRCSEKASGSQGGAALVDPNGGASNSGSAQSSAASQPSRLSRARTARLRIEFATNRESQLLSWAVYLCTLLIDAAVVVMVSRGGALLRQCCAPASSCQHPQ